jgi:hypothetical protein
MALGHIFSKPNKSSVQPRITLTQSLNFVVPVQAWTQSFVQLKYGWAGT